MAKGDPLGWWKERLDDLTGRMGPGLLGKIGPVFLSIELVSAAALFQLPSEIKWWGFALGAGAAIGYFVLAGIIVVLHPILGNMDGKDALAALRAESKAKNFGSVIPGTSRPIANHPAQGIGQQQKVLK